MMETLYLDEELAKSSYVKLIQDQIWYDNSGSETCLQMNYREVNYQRIYFLWLSSGVTAKIGIAQNHSRLWAVVLSNHCNI